MDRRFAKRIKIGNRVCIWPESPDACTGTAIEVGYNAVKFQWDDGQIGIIHHDDMANVVTYPAAAPNIIPPLDRVASA